MKLKRLVRAGIAALICSIHCGFPNSASAAEFIPLGDLPGGEFRSNARAVTDDGRVVIGISIDADEDGQAYRWTPEEGMVALGELPGGFHRSSPQGLSANGSVVAGTASIEGPSSEAFRWTQSDGMVGLGDFSDSKIESGATDISADGQVIVGQGRSDNGEEAYIWTEADGFTGLGDLEGGRFWSVANAVSGDGQVIVGWSESGVDVFEAYRWTVETGMQGLGDLPGGKLGSQANDVSDDGTVIVGMAEGESGTEAFRWTAEGGMTGLGAFANNGSPDSIATGVSGDGLIVVGQSLTSLGNEAFIWTKGTGLLRLQDVLSDQGASGVNAWERLSDAYISSNGEWIVGRGRNPSGNWEAYLANIDREALTGFTINAGLNDAWYNPATAGQGFLITVFPDRQEMFVAWFTFDIERPPEEIEAMLGEPGHRWVTGQGSYSGDTASLTVSVTEGGVFDSADPAASNDGIDHGTLTIEFADCTEALVTYEMSSPSVSGVIPIERITNDNVALCQALAND